MCGRTGAAGKRCLCAKEGMSPRSQAGSGSQAEQPGTAQAASQLQAKEGCEGMGQLRAEQGVL